jgi:hypothetical protein
MAEDTKSDPGVVVVALAFVVPAALWTGWVASKMWGWFVVPQFGARPLPIATAIGLSWFVFLWFKKWPDDSKPTTIDTFSKSLAQTIVWPALVLLAGWIAQHWVPTP